MPICSWNFGQVSGCEFAARPQRMTAYFIRCLRGASVPRPVGLERNGLQLPVQRVPKRSEEWSPASRGDRMAVGRL